MHENIQIYNNHHIRKNFHYQSNNNKFLNIIKENDSTFSKISFHNFDKSLSLVEKETVVSGSRGRRSRFFFNPSQMADSFRPINRQ